MHDPEHHHRTAAVPVGQVLLSLGDGDGENPKHILSAETRVGDTLFVAGDEMAVLEALTLDAAGCSSAHVRYALADLLDLRRPREEVDI